MSLSHGLKIPDPSNLIDIIDAANSKHTSGSGDIKSGTNNILWERNGTITDVSHENVKCFDMNPPNGSLLTTSGVHFYGQYYTAFYLWKPRETDSDWRTLHRNSGDHVAIVERDARNLGYYSSRNGTFRNSGYVIEIEWQTLIVTGEGESEDTPYGTSTFYVNGVEVGTADRVASGTSIRQIGYNQGQNPGYLAVAGTYNKKLNLQEIQELHQALEARI